MAQRLESNPKNPALFLLAMLKNGNASVKLGESGRLEVGPLELATRLAPKIREHKANLVRFLLQLDCSECGFEMRFDGQAALTGKTWSQGLKCPSGHKAFHDMPDFPVYDKNGKEI